MILKYQKRLTVKQFYNFLYIVLTLHIIQISCDDINPETYEMIITQNACAWKNKHLEILADSHHLATILDLILSSHYIIQEACKLNLAKLTIQEELYSIYTPALQDSWYTNMQVSKNDIKKLEQALTAIKQSQLTFHELITKMKILVPRLLQVNPQLTQDLISDFKNTLLLWSKQQQDITNELILIQHEFSFAISSLSDIKTMYDSSLYQTIHLKDAATSVAQTYQNIESVILHLTKVRKQSILKIQAFFSCFFRTYYAETYSSLSKHQQESFISLIATNKKFPAPFAF